MVSSNPALEIARRAREIYKEHGMKKLIRRIINYYNKKILLEEYINSIILNILFDRFVREDLVRQSEIYEFSGSSNVQVDPPDYHVDPVPDRLREHVGSYYFDPPFVSVIEDVEVIGEIAAPFSSKSAVILEDFSARKHKWEEYASQSNNFMRLVQYRLANQTDPDMIIGEACSFLNIQRAGYSDWVHCGVSRFQGLFNYIEKTGRRPKAILRPNPPSWTLQYLNLLGYSEDDIVEWDGDHLHIDRFIVPTVPTPEFDEQSFISHLGRFDDHLRIVNPKSSAWLRQELSNRARKQIRMKSDSAPSYEKIYISRQRANYRYVCNFDKLREYLLSEGFKIYNFEKLSVCEQIIIISEAEVIISPHGAGLANLVYSSDKTVIELFGERKRKATYFLLAKTLDYDYGFVLCNNNRRGLTVDIEKLQKVVKSVAKDTDC